MSEAAERFLDTCERHEVYLDGMVADSVASGEVEGIENIGYKSGLLAGIITAARSLERHSDLQLADVPIPMSELRDTPSRILSELINRSLGSLQQGTAALRVTEPAMRVRGLCPDVERHWNTTFRELEKGKGGAPNVHVFMEGGEPAVVRKGLGDRTGLLLRDAVLGKKGVQYRAGSVVDLSTRRDQYANGRPPLPNEGLLILPASMIDKMSFRRITPYMLSEAEQREHCVGLAESCRSIDEIRELVQCAVEQSIAEVDVANVLRVA